MGNLIDLTGERFGRLTVLKQAGKNKHRQLQWHCLCDCGSPTIALGFVLRKGEKQSCGCLKRESIAAVNLSHGMSRTPIYRIWRSMLDRCHLPSSHAYSRYGGRGIKVCDRWQDFENFYADMGDRPKGMSLERTDNDGDYCPENVRWASNKEQANNRRANVYYEYGDERLTLAQWAEKGEVSVGTLWSRLKRGVPFPACLLNIDLRTLRGSLNNAG